MIFCLECVGTKLAVVRLCWICVISNNVPFKLLFCCELFAARIAQELDVHVDNSVVSVHVRSGAEDLSTIWTWGFCFPIVALAGPVFS